MVLKVDLIRPDDLLNLHIELINMRVDGSDAENPAIAPTNPQQPSYLVVHFPPQTIVEQAFFETSEINQKIPKGELPGVVEPDKTRVNRDQGLADNPLLPPGNITSRLGGTSRLVFRVPQDARVPFTIEGLLDWSKLALVVSPIADVEFGADPPEAALTIRPPIAPSDDPQTVPETTIELPYRLSISPRHNVVWDHALKMVSHRGRVELWHTRLASYTSESTIQRTDEAHPLPLRAIWSPDFPKEDWSPRDFGEIGVLTAISPFDRRSIVLLTSAFQGYASDRISAYVPKPFEVSQLMLSSLGGWLHSVGSWNPPYKIKPRPIIPLPNWDDWFKGKILFVNANNETRALLPNQINQAEIANLINAEVARPQDNPLATVNIDNREVANLPPGIGDILLNPDFFYDLGEQLDLSQWVHRASQGRDHYVRIVYEGKLKGFGHRAALVKVTERRFEEDPTTKAPVAYLRQFMYIVVREPEKDYSKEGLAYNGRGMPLKKICLTTLVTPKIDYPYTGKPAITDRSFWIMVGGDDFQFNATGTDEDGGTINFAVPLIFVPNSEMTNAANLQKIDREFSSYKNSNRRAAKVPGQRVAFAPSKTEVIDGKTIRKDNTSFVAQTLNFVNEGASAEQFFKPILLKADVRIPAVEQLVGTNTLTSIQMLPKYLSNNGFDDPTNLTGVFAEIIRETVPSDPNNPSVLEAAKVGLEFAANQAGGFATPNLDITSLSRQLGPLGGDVSQAIADQFDPAKYFQGAAKIFGAFDLANLIPKEGSSSKNAPKMQIRREGTTAIAELDWNPDVQNIPRVVIEFRKFGDTSLNIHGIFKKDIGTPSKDDFLLTGTLNHFEIFFLQVVQINFEQFSFTAQSGKKTDVNVKLDSATPVKFIGDLEFVEGLRQVIPPGVFGDGVKIDLLPELPGVKAGLSLGLPPAAVGVFALQNIAFDAGLTIPFISGKPIFDFGFARRDNPFLLTVSLLGGGGFFNIQVDTDGLKGLEVAFEFGAVAAINLGVASGEVHIMAGIYFKMEKRKIKELGDAEKTVSLLTGYLRIGGKLSVLGIISVSVEFNLSFTYIPLVEGDPKTGKAYGRATLTVTIEIAFFSKSVELTVERSFGSKGGDPTFRDLTDSPAIWGEYAAAFA